jgi:putative aldouronate transport system permease protein
MAKKMESTVRLRDQREKRRREFHPNTGAPRSKKARTGFFGFDSRQLEVQSMVLPGILLLIVFLYVPMYYLIIAFKRYDMVAGIWESQWVGLKYFREFVTSRKFLNVLRNTLAINILQQIFAFPAPIILAILLNELRNSTFKRVTQTISYLPHFVSWVIFGGLVIEVLSKQGIVNRLLQIVGLIEDPIFFMGVKEWFWFIAVFAGIAKSVGWGSIIYLAAISGIDPQLYDAAYVDGATRFQRIWYITIPSISGTIIILLILNISLLLNTSFDHIWMLQNPLNLEMSDTIEIYVYKVGLRNYRFSYATAVGLFQSAIAVILLVLANTISNKVSNKGIY